MSRPCRICRKCPIYREWDGSKDRRGTVQEGKFDLLKTLEEVNGKKMLPDGCEMQARRRWGFLGKMLR